MTAVSNVISGPAIVPSNTTPSVVPMSGVAQALLCEMGCNIWDDAIERWLVGTVELVSNMSRMRIIREEKGDRECMSHVPSMFPSHLVQCPLFDSLTWSDNKSITRNICIAPKSSFHLDIGLGNEASRHG